MKKYFSALILAALGTQVLYAQQRPVTDIINDLERLVAELKGAAAPPASNVISVPSKGDLQAALDKVADGGQVQLAEGGIYTGNYVIRRSNFQLLTNGATKAKVASGNGASILVVAPGVHDVKVINVYFGPFNGNDAVSIGLNDSSQTTKEQQPRRIEFNNVMIEADATSGAKRGLAMHCADCSLINSTIRGFKRVGQDTQAVYGVNGEGPFTILNNDLEAAGENIMFGGDAPRIVGLVPADIRIEANRIYKDLAWKGSSFTAKNLIELKAGRRVKIYNNSLRYSWLGQGAYAIMLTPSDSASGGANPTLSVEDVDIDSNVIFDVGAGVNILGNGQNSVTAQTKNIRIANNWITTDSCTYSGQGWPVFLSRGPANVTIERNTIEMKCGSQMIVYQEGPPVLGFRFTGNLVPRSGTYGFSGTANGTTSHRAANLQIYYPGGVVTGNALGSFPTPSNLPNNLHLATSAVTIQDGIGQGAVSAYGRTAKAVPTPQLR